MHKSVVKLSGKRDKKRKSRDVELLSSSKYEHLYIPIATKPHEKDQQSHALQAAIRVKIKYMKEPAK